MVPLGHYLYQHQVCASVLPHLPHQALIGRLAADSHLGPVEHAGLVHVIPDVQVLQGGGEELLKGGELSLLMS